MHLNSYQIANFKSIGSTSQEIKLKPITLLFGPNSSGKSSIIQSLLWLNHLIQTGDADVRYPQAAKGKIDLGGFSQFIHKRDPNQQIRVTLSINLDTKAHKDTKSLERWNLPKNAEIEIFIGWCNKAQIVTLLEYRIILNDQELLCASIDKEKGPGVYVLKRFNFKHEAFTKQVDFICHMKSNDSKNKTPNSGKDNVLALLDQWILDTNHPEVIESSKETIFNDLSDMFDQGSFSLIKSGKFLPKILKWDINSYHVKKKCALFSEKLSKDSSIKIFPTYIKSVASNFITSTFDSSMEALLNFIEDSLSHSFEEYEYIPPLRELPERGFNIEDADPLWTRLMDEVDLLDKVNKWLENPALQTQYRIEASEYISTRALSESLSKNVTIEIMALLSRIDFSDDVESVKDSIIEEWKKLDKIEFLNAHPEIKEEATRQETTRFEDDGEEEWENLSEEEKENRLEYIFEGWLSDFDPEKDYIDFVRGKGDDWRDNAYQRFLESHKSFKNLLDKYWQMESFSKRLTESAKSSEKDIRHGLVLRDLKFNTEVALQDVGVGISQVLPILIRAYGDKNKLICIEQPEIHIHPALQAEMGDLFIESSLGKNKNTFLLETHSEHLILRILRRIRETAEGEMDDWPEELRKACPNGITPDDVSVLFVEPSNEGSKIRLIEITPDGDFAQAWPGGFFAERSKELF